MTNWAHQQKEWDIGRNRRGRYLMWPMRSGKSKACIDKACFQYKKNAINGLLIVAPNGVHLNWTKNQLPLWMWPGIDYRAFAWSTPRRGEQDQIDLWNDMINHDGLKVFSINFDALKHQENRVAVKRFLLNCQHKFMLIVSEGHHIGRPGTRRTFFTRSLARHAAFRMVESGTGLLQSPLKAFTQFEVVEKGCLGFEDYGSFKVQYADWEVYQRGTGGAKRARVKNFKNIEELRTKISKFTSVVLRQDIHDMPSLIRVDRPVIMSDLQRRAYLEIVNEHVLAIDSGVVIDARDAGARMMKLQQVLNGYVMKDGSIHTIDPLPPIMWSLYDELCGTLPGKSIIWCRFREDIRRVRKWLDQHFKPHATVEFHGGITGAFEREANRMAFQSDDRVLFMLGIAATGGEGLDMSVADSVIYFSSTPNAVHVTQSEERATAIGGKSVGIIRLRTYGTVDDRNWKIVDGRLALHDTLSGSGLKQLLLQTEI